MSDIEKADGPGNNKEVSEESTNVVHGFFSEYQKKLVGSIKCLDSNGNVVEVTQVSYGYMPSVMGKRIRANNPFYDLRYVGLLRTNDLQTDEPKLDSQENISYFYRSRFNAAGELDGKKSQEMRSYPKFSTAVNAWVSDDEQKNTVRAFSAELEYVYVCETNSYVLTEAPQPYSWSTDIRYFGQVVVAPLVSKDGKWFPSTTSKDKALAIQQTKAISDFVKQVEKTGSRKYLKWLCSFLLGLMVSMIIMELF